MTHTASAPGKIILTGEYAVVFGYPGVAIPSSMRVEVTVNEDASRSNLEVLWNEEHDSRWDAYVLKIIELCQQKKDLLKGTLIIKNQIPLGSGMGSSTAFVIAITRALLGPDCEEDAREIENQMSPGNSGMDFAVIWNESPIVFSKDEGAEQVELPARILDGAFLIDTGAPLETTSELIALVQQKKEGSDDIEDALRTIGHSAERLLDNQKLVTIFKYHHRAQVTLGVVPLKVQELIAKIEAAGGAAKVIGAGGMKKGAGIVLAIGVDQALITDYPHFPL